VWGFKANSPELLEVQKQQIKKITTEIVKSLKRDLQGKGSTCVVRLRIVYEGHLDKKTDDPAKYDDPAKGKALDTDRAATVAVELREHILKNMGQRVLLSIPELSGAGSTRPFGSGSDPQKNRRVAICFRWKIEC
jgi:hypothetical protein